MQQRKRRFDALNKQQMELKEDADNAFYSLQLLDNMLKNKHTKNPDGDYIISKKQYDAFRRLLLKNSRIYQKI